MICTSLYGVNEASLRGYNNIMIASLWNCITLTLRSIVLYDGIDVGCMDRLLSNRDTCGFKSVMESNNAALSMTSTSSALLAARQRLLDSRTEGEAAPVGQVVFTQHSATRVYGCLSLCLLDVANVTRMGDHTCSQQSCLHTKYKALVFANPYITEICLHCGINEPCSMLVLIGDNYVFRESEQSM